MSGTPADDSSADRTSGIIGRPSPTVLISAPSAEAQALKQVLLDDGYTVISAGLTELPARLHSHGPFAVIVDLDQADADTLINQVLDEIGRNEHYRPCLLALGSEELAATLGLKEITITEVGDGASGQSLATVLKGVRVFDRPIDLTAILEHLKKVSARAALRAADSGSTPEPSTALERLPESSLVSSFPSLAALPEVAMVLPELGPASNPASTAALLSPDIEALLEESAVRVRAAKPLGSGPAPEPDPDPIVVPPELLAKVAELLAQDEPGAAAGPDSSAGTPEPVTSTTTLARTAVEAADLIGAASVASETLTWSPTTATMAASQDPDGFLASLGSPLRDSARRAAGGSPLASGEAFELRTSPESSSPVRTVSRPEAAPSGLMSPEARLPEATPPWATPPVVAPPQVTPPVVAPPRAAPAWARPAVKTPPMATLPGPPLQLEEAPPEIRILSGDHEPGKTAPPPDKVPSQDVLPFRPPPSSRPAALAEPPPSSLSLEVPPSTSDAPPTQAFDTPGSRLAHLVLHPLAPPAPSSAGDQYGPMTLPQPHRFGPAGQPASEVPSRPSSLPPPAARPQSLPVDTGSFRAEGSPIVLLAQAITRRETGALRLTAVGPGGPQARRILLREGDIVTASSELPQETLICFLVERGDLTAELAQSRIARLPQTGRHAAAALIANGFLSQDDLWPVLRAHAEWIIARTLLDSQASAEIEQDPQARLRAEPNVFGGAAGVEIFLETIRRIIPPAEALRRLGGRGVRLSISSDHAPLLAESALSAEQAASLRSVRDTPIGQLLEPEGDELAAVLYALVMLQVLTTAPGSGRPATAGVADDGSAELFDPLDADAVRQRIGARLALVQEGDYFTLLGLKPNATSYEIKRAYLELRRSFEPTRLITAATADLADDVQLILEVLAEAYDILRDPHRRSRYRRAIEATAR